MLIDTHILLWTLEGVAGRMGPKTVQQMQKDFGNAYVSTASLFEIKMKQRRGGLLQFDVDTMLGVLRNHGTTIFDISAAQLAMIPGKDITEHADPFDLLLIAQAVAENVPFLTCDEKILKVALPGLRLIDGRV